MSTAPYMAFTHDTDPKTAAAIFVERYGVEPEEFQDCGDALLVGPVPTDQHGQPVPPKFPAATKAQNTRHAA